jgi:molybdenum cofactor biosynthesis protein B
MVDFQSRDTRRSVDDDEDDDAAAEAEAEAEREPEATDADADESAEVTTDDGGDETATDDSGDEGATDDAADEPATDDAGDEPATDDAGDESATDDAGDESTDTDLAADQTGYAVVTVSVDPEATRTSAGRAAVDAIEGVGDAVTWQDGIRNEYDAVQGAVGPLVDREDVEVVVTVGGTGVAPGDVTVEAVAPLLEKHLSGFGELLRSRFAEEIGSAAMGVRVTAGVIEGTPVFCLPADAGAVDLAMAEFVLPEAPGLAEMARGT